MRGVGSTKGMDTDRQTHRKHRKGHEDALRKLEPIEDDRLAMIVHELKTPLHGVLGLTEAILCGAQGEISPQQRESLEIVYSCAERLSRMTESMLQLSRMPAGEEIGSESPEVHRLADHLEEALLDLRVIAGKSSTELRLSVPPDFEGLYRREPLESLVRVLADNAVKYAPGGIVEVIARDWRPPRPAGFQLAVRDTGPGIPGEFQEKIFEPFYRHGDPESLDAEGVGLGLSIALKAAARLGGRILLESEVGKGATFTVLVPRDAEQRFREDLYEPWSPLE